MPKYVHATNLERNEHLAGARLLLFPIPALFLSDNCTVLYMVCCGPICAVYSPQVSSRPPCARAGVSKLHSLCPCLACICASLCISWESFGAQSYGRTLHCDTFHQVNVVADAVYEALKAKVCARICVLKSVRAPACSAFSTSKRAHACVSARVCKLVQRCAYGSTRVPVPALLVLPTAARLSPYLHSLPCTHGAVGFVARFSTKSFRRQEPSWGITRCRSIRQVWRRNLDIFAW